MTYDELMTLRKESDARQMEALAAKTRADDAARRAHEVAEVPSYNGQDETEENLWDLAMRDPVNVSVEEIKRHFTIAGLLGRPDGNGRRWVTLCPLHAETTPSFVVFPDGRYKCFGCGEKGDVITLYAKLNKISNREAIREMASQI